MTNDTAFQMSASNIRFGPGTTAEVGLDLKSMNVRRTLLVIDPRVRELPTGQTVLESLRSCQVDFAVFDQVEVEPTDASFQAAVAFATEGDFDSIVAVGGGSTIDTAKAATGWLRTHIQIDPESPSEGSIMYLGPTLEVFFSDIIF